MLAFISRSFHIFVINTAFTQIYCINFFLSSIFDLPGKRDCCDFYKIVHCCTRVPFTNFSLLLYFFVTLKSDKKLRDLVNNSPSVG